MYDHHLYLKTLSEFSAKLLTPYDVQAALTDLSDRVTGVLDLAGSGASLGRGDRLVFDTACGGAAAEVERTQQESQAGPCVVAYRTATRVVVPDLSQEHGRWPEYCAAAQRAGIGAVASIPMGLHDQVVGALNLYAHGTREWTEEDLDAAHVMADMATVFLLNADRDRKQRALNEQLQQALDTRVAIEQAKGIVAARLGITPDAAFDQLRQYARAHNTSLRALCQSVVDRRTEL